TGRVVRALRVHARRDLGYRFVRPMGRRAGQGFSEAHHPRAGEQGRAQARSRQLHVESDPPLSQEQGERMKTPGFDQPLYILPFDHRGSFQTKLFGWPGKLTAEQTAEIAASKQVVYDGFVAALKTGVPKAKAGILVDEQFGSAILENARSQGYTTACPA